MGYFDEVKREIDRGREGEYAGIPVPQLPRMNKYLGGIQAGRYDLLGADSGVGKTSFADFFYVISPIESIIEGLTDFDYMIDYWSLEISKKRKLVKLSALYMYLKFGIITDYNELLSRGGLENRLSDNMYAAFLKTEEFIERLQDYVRIHEGKAYPTQMAIWTSKYRKSIGKIKYRDVSNPDEPLLEENPHGKDDPRRYRYERIYAPSSNKFIHLVLVDHIGKIRREHESSEKGSRLLNKKDNIDKHSDFCVEGRDFYGTSYVNVSQFNRGKSDIQRQKYKELRPEREDFKDSGNTFEDADLVYAGFDPEVYNIKSYMGYDVAKLHGRGRFLFILKNRDGAGNVELALRFIGECGHFCEIFTREQIKADSSLYKEILNTNIQIIKPI